MEKLKINAELIITLRSKQDWINRVPRCLPEKEYFEESFLWIDSEGNKMVCGADFSAAEEMETYPVNIYRFKTADQELKIKKDGKTKKEKSIILK